jgi:hypothetical protein
MHKHFSSFLSLAFLYVCEGFAVPEPLVKKRFEGGLYGALMILIGAFDEWSLLDYWAHNNDKHEYRDSGGL